MEMEGQFGRSAGCRAHLFKVSEVDSEEST